MPNLPVRFILASIVVLIGIVLIGHTATANRVPAGTVIGTAVEVTYRVAGVDGPLTLTSNIPYIRLEPRPTTSNLVLRRLTTDAARGLEIEFGDVSFALDATEESTYLSQHVDGFDPTAPTLLIPTDSYLPGDIIFFQLRDEGLNHLPDVAEVVFIRLEGVNGDREVFRLQASGLDSGDFFGYALAVGPETAVPGDGQIAMAENTVIVAHYVDAFDSDDNSVATAVADPRMRTFDALTGDPVDGARVRFIDVETGVAMPVYGIDGTSLIGTTITSGATMTDAAGQAYAAKPGELRVPYLMPGRYRIELEAPSGHVFPSDTPDATIAALPDQDYRLALGARGRVFEFTRGSTPRFDIPLDPRGAFQLMKTADTGDVAHGDFIRYTLTLDNNDDRDASAVTIADALPPGFRYEPGSGRVDDVAVPDPSISDDGMTLSHTLGPIASGSRSVLSYVVRIGAQAQIGPAVSAARASAPGGFRSNEAEAVVTVGDDMLSRTGTVLGRVVIGECDETGEGLRTRLLLETGRIIVTDSEGRFHLDALDDRPHALRLDEYSLPDGLVPHACPDDLRPGDTASARTIEVRNGLLRTVTFRLRRTDVSTDETSAKVATDTRQWTPERLAQLPKRLDIVYPAADASMDDPSLAIGVAYPFGRRVGLIVNGEKVSNLSAQKTIANRAAGMAMRRWHGIDLPDGPSRIVVTISDATGRELDRLTRIVHYVTEPATAEVLDDRSILIANGQTSPAIAIRFTDDAGRPVNAGQRVPITVAPPYQTTKAYARFADDPLLARDSTRSFAEIGPDGVAMVGLRPTARAGEVEMTVQLGTRPKDLRVWLAPDPRPWILVGIADGTVGYKTISDNMTSTENAGFEDNIVGDGHVAFYAKGAIRGDWLLTLAYDSDKGRKMRDRDFFDEIDPNAYYPVYGDASTQDQSAPSRYPLFVRLERGQFFAMFGDYKTGMNRTEMARYERTLSGFKAVYEGDRFQVLAFAAEADQQFRRVELSANQGIGPYELGATDILRNSERVRLVVRERETLGSVISTTELARFTDYSIDYETGAIQLQRAPSPTDTAFNPTLLVVDFETDQPDPGRITAGGRVAVKLLDERVEIGASAIHEEGGGVDATGDLIALDARAEIGNDIDIIGEVATSRVDEDDKPRRGNAYRAEATYAREGWRARLYFKQADSGFGVAQQSIATKGRRTFGATVSAEIADPLAGADDADAVAYTLTAKAYRDEDLTSRTRRDIGEWLITRPVTYGGYGTGTIGLGYQLAQDRLDTGARRRAHKILGSASASILDGWASVRIERAQTVASSGVGHEPDSTLLQADARLSRTIRAVAGIETFDGESVSSANIHAGLSAEPWTGGRVSVGVNALGAGITEAADRVAATVGVAQDFKITDRLSMGLRFDHTQPLARAESPVVGSVLSSLANTTEESSLASAGLGYSGDGWSASVRVDLSRTETIQTQRLAIGAVGDIMHDLTLAASGDIRHQEREIDGTGQSGTMTIGAAYRPEHGQFTALHRFETRFDTAESERITLVNNISVESKPTDWLTLAGAHGLRVRLQDYDDVRYESLTQFVGLDAYFALTRKWNIGLHGDLLASLDGSSAYAYGSSIGYSPRQGMNLRLGYNVAGFDDEDFSATNATTIGPYARITMRFDETDIRSILPDAGWISALAPAAIR